MNYTKQQAKEALDELHNSIPYDKYCTIHDGLTEIELLRDRDEELEELWERLGDIPMDPETECIEETFLNWPKGTHREEIWHWFDKRHSKGVYYLLYGDGGAGELGKLLNLMKSNPKLPVVPLVDGEIAGDDCGYWVGKWRHSNIDEYLSCERYDYLAFKSDDDVFDVLEKYLSDEDFEKLPEDESECRKVYDSLPWTKAIIVYITTAD